MTTIDDWIEGNVSNEFEKKHLRIMKHVREVLEKYDGRYTRDNKNVWPDDLVNVVAVLEAGVTGTYEDSHQLYDKLFPSQELQ